MGHWNQLIKAASIKKNSMMTRSTKIWLIAIASVLILGGLAFFLIKFLMQSDGYTMAQVCPKTFDDSTENNIQHMQRNLVSIAQHDPLHDIQGQVIFKQGIPPEKFIQLVNKYHLHITNEKNVFGGSSIQIITSSSSDGRINTILGLELTPEFFQKETFSKAVKKNSPPETHLPGETTSSSTIKTMTVINFSANTQAAEFLNLWNENTDLVRAVGVGCTSVFYIVGPTDPIKFGGPSLLR